MIGNLKRLENTKWTNLINIIPKIINTRFPDLLLLFMHEYGIELSKTQKWVYFKF